MKPRQHCQRTASFTAGEVDRSLFLRRTTATCSAIRPQVPLRATPKPVSSYWDEAPGMRCGGLRRPSAPVTFMEYLEQAKKNWRGKVILQITCVKASFTESTCEQEAQGP